MKKYTSLLTKLTSLVIFFVTITPLSCPGKTRTFKEPVIEDIEVKENDKLLNDLWADITPQMTDISFLIADLKYDGNSIKILELGEGTRSYFCGHEQLFGDGKIWHRLWLYLKQFELPIWYVGEEPSTVKKKKQIDYETFCSIGGMCVDNLTDLQEDPIFQKRNRMAIKNFHQTKNYAGVIIFRRHRLPREIIKEFKQKHPHFLFLNNASSPHVNNKKLTNLLFNDKFLKSFKPQWKVYPKEYTNILAKTIQNDFSTTDTYVIKPLNAANGWGVIITDKDHLDENLKTILENKKKLLSSQDTSYSYWARDLNKSFLVEAYVPSKKVIVDEKPYDATMRVVFTLSLNDNKINTSFLGSYWKLPAHSLEEPGTLNEQHKSKIRIGTPSSAKVNSQDLQHVKSLMSSMLPRLYANMLVTKMVSFNDPENSAYPIGLGNARL